MKNPFEVHSEILFSKNQAISVLTAKSLPGAFSLFSRDHVFCRSILYSVGDVLPSIINLMVAYWCRTLPTTPDNDEILCFFRTVRSIIIPFYLYTRNYNIILCNNYKIYNIMSVYL